MAFLDKVKDEAKQAVETLTGITFAKSYKTPIVVGKEIVGFNQNTFGYVDPQYRVTIENNKWVVNAWMQENFEISIDSSWVDLIDIPAFGGLTKTLENLVQGGVKAVTGFSMKNVALTRRKWDGSSPIRISLKLQFRAYEDAEKEVVKACRALQSMVLPQEASNELVKNLMPASEGIVPGFLIPPGPNEQYFSKDWAATMSAAGLGSGWANVNQMFGGAGDIISIDMLGGRFYLDLCIIKSVKVSFDPKMTEKGPVAATADVNLESYEVLTKQKLDKAYSGIGYTTTAGAGGVRTNL